MVWSASCKLIHLDLEVRIKGNWRKKPISLQGTYFRIDYNNERPRTSLNGRTPCELANQITEKSLLGRL